MDKPPSSKLSWTWVIEALASYNKFPLHTLQSLMDASPVCVDDFSQNAKEFIALRCLEDISSYSSSSSSSSSTLKDSSKLPIDSSLTCEGLLKQILRKVPPSNLTVSNLRKQFLKWDLNSFITHKRAMKMKCHLEKIKESILDGTLQLSDELKEKSGLFKTDRANEGKRDDRLSGKRTRVDLADEISGICLDEEEVCIIDYDEFVRNTEKTKGNSSADSDFNKEKQVSRLGKEVSEISRPNVASSSVSQKPVASDKDVIDIASEAELSSDSDVYHNEGKFLRTRHAFRQPQQRKPNVGSSNVSQNPVASNKGVVDTVSEEQLSSDGDMYHNEGIALTAQKDEFMRSRHGQNLCIQCNEAGQLLVCQASTCSLMMHKNCLGDSAQLDANGNFLCPFCEYSRTISDYFRAKKAASFAKKRLAIFNRKIIWN